MQPEAGQPENKKPLTKHWKPQTQRTADSQRKLKQGIDLLRQWVQAHPGEEIPRTEVPYLVHSLLQGLQDRPRNLEHMLHVITTAFFETACEYKLGEQIIVEEAWQKLLRFLQKVNMGLARGLNNEKCRD